jgi:hypothetical protein
MRTLHVLSFLFKVRGKFYIYWGYCNYTMYRENLDIFLASGIKPHIQSRQPHDCIMVIALFLLSF